MFRAIIPRRWKSKFFLRCLNCHCQLESKFVAGSLKRIKAKLLQRQVVFQSQIGIPFYFVTIFRYFSFLVHRAPAIKNPNRHGKVKPLWFPEYFNHVTKLGDKTAPFEYFDSFYSCGYKEPDTPILFGTVLLFRNFV